MLSVSTVGSCGFMSMLVPCALPVRDRAAAVDHQSIVQRASPVSAVSFAWIWLGAGPLHAMGLKDRCSSMHVLCHERVIFRERLQS
jgi:hypothetical protein